MFQTSRSAQVAWKIAGQNSETRFTLNFVVWDFRDMGHVDLELIDVPLIYWRRSWGNRKLERHVENRKVSTIHVDFNCFINARWKTSEGFRAEANI